MHDLYPGGSPEGFVFKDQMKDFATKDINFTIVRVNRSCDKMIKVMEDIYKENGKVLNVSDLADACTNLINI